MTYDDGEVENLDMSLEIWRFSTDGLEAGVILASSLFELKSNLHTDILDMFEDFGNKFFLLHQAQCFPAHMLQRTYNKEKTNFIKTVQTVSRDLVDKNANIIYSHVLYEVS